MENISRLILILGLVNFAFAKWDGNCSNIPLSDDYCCKENTFEDDAANIKSCAQKFNLTFNKNNDVEFSPGNLEAYVCFTDCLYTAEKYMNNGVIDLAFAKADIAKDSKATPELGVVLTAALDKCVKQVDKITEGIKKMPYADKYLKGKCSPTAQIISDCIYMDYYVNCPAKFWANNPACNDIKEYSGKCKLY